MDSQEKIIAFLQGELRNREEVTALLQRVADSPEELDILLKHVDLSRRFAVLGTRMAAMPNPARRAVQERIFALEADAAGQTAVTTTKHGSARAARSGGMRALMLAGLVLAVVIAAAWFGYVTGFDSGLRRIASTPAHATDAAARHDETSAGIAAGDASSSATASFGAEPNATTDNSPSATRLELSSPFGTESSAKAERPTWNLVPALPSPVEQERVQLLAPRGGQQFRSGDIVPVVWSGAADSPMSIEVSDDGGEHWRTIADNVDDNRFLWTVPEGARSGPEYLVRVRPGTDAVRTAPVEIFTADTQGITLDISPDGRHLATAGRNNLITIRDRASGAHVATLSGHGGSIQSCRYSADGSKIVTAALDGTAIVWDVEQRKIIHLLDPMSGINIWWATFSPDGRTVAVATDAGIVGLWDTETGTKLSTLKVHKEGVRYVEFTSDGARLVTASIDRTAAIVDLASGTVMQRFVHSSISRFVGSPVREAAQLAIVNAIQLTEDGSMAVTCGHNGEVKFWDARTGKLIRTRVYHDGEEATMVLLSPDGSTLVSLGADGTLAVVDPRTGAVIDRRSLEASTPMIHAVFGPEPGIVSVSHTDGRVSTWDVRQTGDVSSGFWAIRE